jgi:hypothetical protein
MRILSYPNTCQEEIEGSTSVSKCHSPSHQSSINLKTKEQRDETIFFGLFHVSLPPQNREQLK